MDEKLLGKYLDKVDKMTGEINTVIESTSLAQVKIQARIARQLTRIADQGEPQVVYDMNLTDKPSPVPTDARRGDVAATEGLVEAVKYVIHHYVPGDSMMDIPITKLKNALAAHEKAVT